MMEFPYPPRMKRILLMAMEEVLGEDGLCSVLEAAGECPDTQAGPLNPTGGAAAWAGESAGELRTTSISHLVGLLENIYGSRAGPGIAQRVGRACFLYGLREYGSALGLTQTSFRLLPFPAKLRKLSSALADLLHEHAGQHVSFEKSDGGFLWHTEDCPLCRQRHAAVPSCQFAVGLAEESLYWLSGGKIFQVEEIACAARGDPRCTLQIGESPIS
jgi:predicted hydrocarbon binding protein